MTRRVWLASLNAFAACPLSDEAPLDFEQLPAAAQAIARDLGLGSSNWATYREQRRLSLVQRIDEGSAEHVTYYVLQSRRFTRHEPIDPVRLAATKPIKMPEAVSQRFADFATITKALDARHQLIIDLYRGLPANWTAEACFWHTMRFLVERSVNQREARDALYQRRGLSSDTTPAQTRVIDRALAYLKTLPPGRTLLVGPGLDLTRREGFSDETPLRAYQVERLLSAKAILDCADVRPEVLAYLASRPVCSLQLDVSTTAASASGRYGLAMATNVLLYLDDRALFAALAGLSRSLSPGGYLIHNDARFAAKVFGEVLGLPAVHFEALALGLRGGVRQMDRVVIHRKP